MKSPVSLAALHTHTHTDSFKEIIARNSNVFNVPKNKRIYTRTIVL